MATQVEAENLKTKGNNEFSSQNYQKAADFYLEAIKIDPSIPIYYSNLAACYIKLSDYSNGVQCCQKALNLNNHDVKYKKTLVKLWWRLGICQLNLEDKISAKQSFKKGREIDSTSKELNEELARLNDIPDVISTIPITIVDKLERGDTKIGKIASNGQISEVLDSRTGGETATTTTINDQSITSDSQLNQSSLNPASTSQLTSKSTDSPPQVSPTPNCQMPLSSDPFIPPNIINLSTLSTLIRTPPSQLRQAHQFAFHIPISTIHSIISNGIDYDLLDFLIQSSITCFDLEPRDQWIEKTCQLLNELPKAPRFSLAKMLMTSEIGGLFGMLGDENLRDIKAKWD